MEVENGDVDEITAKADNIASLPVDCNTPFPDQTGFMSDDKSESATSDKTVPVCKDIGAETGLDQNESNSLKLDSGYASATDILLPTGTTTSQSRPGSGSGSRAGTDKEFTSPVQPVHGIQTEDSERTTPMFFIKPVTQDGVGLTGDQGARLEDKGMVSLYIR